MSAPYHAICLKNQKAAKAYLAAQTLPTVLSATNILRGLTTSRQILPCVVLECNAASFVPTNRGNFLSNLSIKFRQNADGKAGVDEDAHQLAAATIFDLFMTDGIAADLTSAGRGTGNEYTCFFVEGVSQSYTIDGNVWESELVLQLNCAGNDVN